MNLSKKLLIFFLLTLIVIIWSIYFLNKDFFQLQTFFSNLEIIQNFILQNFFISIFIFIPLINYKYKNIRDKFQNENL